MNLPVSVLDQLPSDQELAPRSVSSFLGSSGWTMTSASKTAQVWELDESGTTRGRLMLPLDSTFADFGRRYDEALRCLCLVYDWNPQQLALEVASRRDSRTLGPRPNPRTPSSGRTAAHHEPQRIQRKRTKGWRMPEGAVYVGRGSKWGNPFRIGDPHPIFGWPMIADEVVALYRGVVEPHRLLLRVMDDRIPPGVDLACWCKLSDPCHADVLLEIANGGASTVQDGS